LIEGLHRRYTNNEALARLRPELQRYGITRVARQTGLDTIGIPCYAAIRPNSRTLAVHQGKGGDDIAAQLSAIMEAVEFAVAEAPTVRVTVQSIEELVSARQDYFVRDQALPRGYPVDRTARLAWVTGQCLATGRPVHVPLESVALAPNSSDPLPFSQSSNGLAAGFTQQEGTVHAFCELIERDASTLWSMRSLRHCAAAAISLHGVADLGVRQCLAKASDAGFQVMAFDLTTDLGVPVVMALLWSGKPRHYFDVASGVCAHPSAIRALVGAIEEAAQTRISNIAGARDDIDPAEYGLPLPSWIAELTGERDAGLRPVPASMPAIDFAGLPGRMKGRTVVVPLSREGETISVVKLLSGRLEDRSTNLHWRPGPRAIKTMTRL
jgi:YcaO-like protein with predicted kinase domain